MATDAEVTAAGFTLPVGGDYISGGDDAISANARAAYDFARRFKLDFTSSGLSGSTDRTALPNGDYAFWNGDAAAAAGMPNTALGVLQVRQFGTGAGVQIWIPRLIGEPELWISTELSGGWSEFVRVDAGAVETIRMLRSAAPGTLKTAPLALTLGYGGGQTTGTGTTVVIQHMPVAARRVQLHLENRNPRYAMADSPAVAISAAAIGLHTSGGNSSSWTALPGTGDTAYASGWIDVPEAWRGQDVAVRYTWSSSGTVQRNIGTGWTDGATDTTPPLFAWLELEVPAETPVVAAFGDSLSSGVSSSRPVVDSWIDQYARQIGAVPAHWSHSGDKASGWQGRVERKWGMYGWNIAAPDALVYFMGSNDLAEPSITAWEMQSRIRETVDALRARITPVVFGATLLPRNDQDTASTFETVRRDVNAWLPGSGLFRHVFGFAAAISSDDDTILPAYNADGTHLTTAGYAALAGAITQPLVDPPPPPGPAEYMSGQRLLALENGATGLVYIMRTGYQVELYVRDLVPPADPRAAFVTIPAGFRPARLPMYGLIGRTGARLLATFDLGSGYSLNQGTSHTSAMYLLATWSTSDPIPTTLPGSPA